jgi:excisionase family DNA binding protein
MRKREACARLAISPATLDRWVRAGRLRRIKLGDRISAYALADVQALVENATVGVAAQAASEEAA